MAEFSWLVFAASLCLLLGAFLLIRDANRRLRLQDDGQRLTTVLARHEQKSGLSVLPSQEAWLPPLFERLFQRSGLRENRRIYGYLLTAAFLLFILGELAWGIWGGLLLTLLLYPLALSVYLGWRMRLFRSRVVSLLPAFLESISSILSVGCSLELAFRNASEECEEPLYGITQQVLLRTRAGQSLEDAMMQVADIYGIQELGFVASVFHMGMRYGGNAHAVLERLSVTMRERERSQQELRAMTGETRASAWILSALPLVVGLLTLITNPGYLLGLWLDPLGRKLLIAAFVLQLSGMALLFRMAKVD